MNELNSLWNCKSSNYFGFFSFGSVKTFFFISFPRHHPPRPSVTAARAAGAFDKLRHPLRSQAPSVVELVETTRPCLGLIRYHPFGVDDLFAILGNTARSRGSSRAIGAFDRLRHPLRSQAPSVVEPAAPAALQHLPEHLGKVHVLQRGGFTEERGYLAGRVARNAAPYGGDEEREFGMGLGTGDEVLHRFLQRGVTLHGGQGVRAAGESLAHTPLGAELLVCIPRRPAAVGSLNVAAKDKNLVCSEVGNPVRRNAATVDDLGVFHGVKCLVFYFSGIPFFWTNSALARSICSRKAGLLCNAA